MFLDRFYELTGVSYEYRGLLILGIYLLLIVVWWLWIFFTSGRTLSGWLLFLMVHLYVPLM
ncbi:MAG: hypothetical protein R3C11_28020 [Planctomycetaceae bacterium]